MRKKRSNSGKPLENLIEQEAKRYEAEGLLMLRKADPPSFTRNINGVAVTMLTSNPFPDFVGVMEGRMLCIEAKSTKEDRLPFGKSGLRSKQLDDLRQWRKFGAVVGVIWANPLGYHWVTLDDVDEVALKGKKSVKSCDVIKIPQAVNHVLDLLGTLYGYI